MNSTTSNKIKSTKNKRGRVTFGKRQEQIIGLLCQEYSNDEIAEMLGISRRTVENHRLIIMKKIGAKNLAGLVIFAIQHKIFKVPKKN